MIVGCLQKSSGAYPKPPHRRGRDRMFLPDKNLNPAPVEARKPFTPDVAGLIAWLETQDGATEYDYIDGSDCLLCRFAEAILGRAPTGWLEVLDLLPYPAVNEPCLRDAAYPYWGS